MLRVIHVCLFEKLNELQYHVLYFDTDSIIYCVKNNKKKLKCGNFLGELTSKLEEGKWTESFCLTGLKYYSFITNFGRRVVHVKGFSLKGEGKEKITFESMKKSIENFGQKIEIKYSDVIT